MAINAYGNQTTSGSLGPRPQGGQSGLNLGASRGITNSFVAQGNANIQKRGNNRMDLTGLNASQAPGSAPITSTMQNGVPSFTNLQQQVAGGMSDVSQGETVQTPEAFVEQQVAGNQRVADMQQQKREQLVTQNTNDRVNNLMVARPNSGITAADLTAGQLNNNTMGLRRDRNMLSLNNGLRSLSQYLDSFGALSRDGFRL